MKINLLNHKLLAVCGLAMSALFGASNAAAITITQTGMFTADNQVFQYNFSLPTASSASFFTTSYTGGMNLDGTTSAGGGFVPVLTLFSASGSPVANDGDARDARINATLAAGAYTLTLTEFPNVAIGNLSDGFLFASDPNATGNACGVSGGQFLDSTKAPCVQRTANYALNVNSTPVSATPEPGTLFLLAPALGGALLFRRRLAARS